MPRRAQNPARLSSGTWREGSCHWAEAWARGEGEAWDAVKCCWLLPALTGSCKLPSHGTGPVAASPSWAKLRSPFTQAPEGERSMGWDPEGAPPKTPARQSHPRRCQVL